MQRVYRVLRNGEAGTRGQYVMLNPEDAAVRKLMHRREIMLASDQEGAKKFVPTAEVETAVVDEVPRPNTKKTRRRRSEKAK